VRATSQLNTKGGVLPLDLSKVERFALLHYSPKQSKGAQGDLGKARAGDGDRALENNPAAATFVVYPMSDLFLEYRSSMIRR
jgi:hypothetical protein